MTSLRISFLGLIAFAYSSLSAQSETDTVAIPIDTVTVLTDTLTIIGVGDIMMGTNYPENKLPQDDGSHLMKAVEAYLKNADITFGNLEGTLLDDGGTPKKCRDPKVCYVFRTPVKYVQNLTNAGFDIMSLANNHAGDFGVMGRTSTMETLNAAGIAHAGQLAQKFVVVEKDSIKYGLVAFAPNSGCVDINDLDEASRLVSHLDSICDIVIVSFHGGAEGAEYQNVPRANEYFYGENRGDVYHLSHTLIDAGADIIFGHGPHVTRAIEVYKQRFIAYSLGNFCTYRGISVSGINGLAPIMRLYTDRDGKFLRGQIIPTYQTYGEGVRVDPQNQAIKKIQELTKKDFPESQIQIAENGFITYLAQ
ncbi:MAG: CapA family protein [Cyclobacteriaceae bacterium]|nr:CapA family protein [Cyclobacteriaceae bacterium]MDH4298244.1 CapA family protein [Cyclobacteriaceae bacterium]MDH5247780.1 CapA family protein [Cyclobacteriaceae bacterium]